MRIVRYENVMHIVSGVYDAKAGDQVVRAAFSP